MGSLAPFLPPHVVRSLLRDGAPARLPHVERVPAALLIADISGFTALTERLESRGREGAEEIGAVVNRVFAPALRTLDRYGGSVCSFGGDALFAIFDGPSPVGCAVAAAEEIAAAFARRGEVATSAGVVRLGLKQAIHQGTVRGVHLGRAGRRRYVACGPSVSALARLESLAPDGGILVSRAAARARAGEPPPRPDRRGPPRAARAELLAYVEPHVVRASARFRGELRRAVMVFFETSGHATVAMQRFALALDAALERYGGILVGTDLSVRGTKWLCAFGAPAAHEDDVERAGRTALEVCAAPGIGPVRCGMDVGPVANIWIGGPSRRSFELLGDVTNTAARTLERALPGEVLITERTRRLMPGGEMSPRGRHAVKGKSAPLELHALAALRAGAGRHVPDVPMVGREAELARIVAALQALPGGGAVVAIVGEAGLGKSRLKLEAATRARELGIWVHEGRATSIPGMPYRVVGAMVRSLLGVDERSEDVALHARIDAVAGELGLSRVERNHLASVLGARFPGSDVGRLAPRTASLNDGLAIQKLCLGIARSRPLMLVLEDMHWADGASVEAVRFLARGLGAAPVLLLLLSRPGYAPPELAAVMKLEELPAADVDRLLTAHLGPVPERTRELVADRAGGNPFYVEELVRHLRESGRLASLPAGRGAVRELDADDLPAGVETLIAARLDALPAEARRVAQAAAVLGRAFSLGLLEELPGTASIGARGVATLESRELVFPSSGAPEREYIWKHALTRDVAYASILSTHRRRLHRAVADAYERRQGGLQATLLPAIAHHRERAGQRAAARAALRQAAAAALERHALREAEELLVRYLSLLDGEDRESVQARLDLAMRVLEIGGRRAEAHGHLETAAQVAGALGATDLQARASFGTASLMYATERLAEARATHEHALRLAREAGDRTCEARVLDGLGCVLAKLGEGEAAAALQLRALALVPEGDDPEEIHGFVLGNLGILRYHEGRLDEARALLDRAIAWARATGNLAFEGATLGSVANVLCDQGSRAEGRRHYEQALRIARRVGDRIREGLFIGNLATLDSEEGRRADAKVEFEQALQIAREIGGRQLEQVWLRNLAAMALDEGRLEDARACAEPALEIARATGGRGSEGISLLLCGQVDAEAGRLDEARSRCELALEILRECGNRHFEGVACRLLAGLELVRTGEVEAAVRHSQAAEAVVLELREPLEIARTLCGRGQLELAAGRDATPFLERARSAVEHLQLDGPGTTLGKDLGRLARAQAAFAAGEPLVAGWLPEDVPPPLLGWLRRHRPEAVGHVTGGPLAGGGPPTPAAE